MTKRLQTYPVSPVLSYTIGKEGASWNPQPKTASLCQTSRNPNERAGVILSGGMIDDCQTPSAWIADASLTLVFSGMSDKAHCSVIPFGNVGKTHLPGILYSSDIPFESFQYRSFSSLDSVSRCLLMRPISVSRTLSAMSDMGPFRNHMKARCAFVGHLEGVGEKGREVRDGGAGHASVPNPSLQGRDGSKGLFPLKWFVPLFVCLCEGMKAGFFIGMGLFCRLSFTRC